MADWTSLRYAVADVEGNGQQPPDLVELAVLPITDGVMGEPVSWLVKPPRPITYFATSIHGISGKDVASAPVFADIEHEMRRALTDRVLVAHNAHVDVAVLRRELDGWESMLVTARLFARLATRHDGNPVSLDELRGQTGCQKPGGPDEAASLF
jgi:exodeoxyribonuclease X